MWIDVNFVNSFSRKSNHYKKIGKLIKRDLLVSVDSVVEEITWMSSSSCVFAIYYSNSESNYQTTVSDSIPIMSSILNSFKIDPGH